MVGRVCVLPPNIVACGFLIFFVANGESDCAARMYGRSIFPDTRFHAATVRCVLESQRPENSQITMQSLGFGWHSPLTWERSTFSGGKITLKRLL